jgi:hypothetical protein
MKANFQSTDGLRDEETLSMIMDGSVRMPRNNPMNWNGTAVIRISEFFACRMDLFADRFGFQTIDSLHQAGELVSEFAGYLLKVQSIRGNWCRDGRNDHPAE